MKKMTGLLLIALLLAGVLFPACADDKENGSPKGKIETFTHETAEKAVKKMRTPINKARAVKDLQENRGHEIEKNIDE